MWVKVGLLFDEGGRPIARHDEMRLTPAVFGKLSYSDQYEKAFRRSVYSARLHAVGGGADQLPPLRDAVVRWIGDGIITIGGLEEDEITRKRVAQGWYVEVLQGAPRSELNAAAPRLSVTQAEMEAIMNDLGEARHRRLVKELQQAALNLFEETSSHGMHIRIEGTTPPVYVVIGDANSLTRLCNLAAASVEGQ